jgi:hypothetical protein
MYDFWGCVIADATATKARNGRILSFIVLELIFCRCSHDRLVAREECVAGWAAFEGNPISFASANSVKLR